MAIQAPDAPPPPPPDEARYGWPGADADDLASRVASIARQLARAGRRVIGFLPAARVLAPGATLSPLLAAVGRALAGFTTESIALIDSWPTWAWAAGGPGGETPQFRSRALQERLIEVAPLPCADPESATLALQMALGALPAPVVTVLVDLSGYAAPGLAPAAADVVDGVVLVARAGRTLGDDLIRPAKLMASKNVGTILIDRG